MADFFDTDEDTLKVPENLMFNHNEIVKCQCLDTRQNMQTGSFGIKVKVLSGPHAGKQTTIYLNAAKNEASAKVKAQFFTAFWTPEEVKNKQCKPAKLVGRFFTVRSKVSPPKEGQSKSFQNWEDFKDLGTSDGAAPAAQPAGTVSQPQGAAPAQSAPTAAQQTTF